MSPPRRSITRVALAGAGWVAAVHGLAAAEVEEVSIVRVASRRTATAARRARQAGGVACAYDDLPGDADAVIVATPPPLHRREAERAVAGGALALVETPLAATLADADTIVELADRGRVAYGENLVHSPLVAEAVRARRQPGDATHLEVRIAQPRPEPGSPRLDGSWGGGVLLDLGVHALALALLLAAPARPVSVGATFEATEGAAVEDEATLVLTFDSGLVGHVRASWRSAAATWDAQVATATSAVRLELVPSPVVELNGAPLRTPPPPAGLPTDQLHHLGYLAQLRALAADVAAGERPRVGPAFGRLVLEIVCAAATAARTGRPETLPFAGPRDRTPRELWRGA